MENEIWERHANNTNTAEAAHAQANREGKQQSKLLIAIMRIIKIAEIHDRYGVPYTRRDKSEIKKQTRAMTQKSGKQKYSKNQKQSRKARKKGSKMKGSNKQKYKTKKSRVDIIEINSDQENEDQDIMLNIEIEERS
ncbi:hypothetical protein RhiirA4_480030 [Rhizophagus irregularis]|uniref:Uncharacterized protein n=1 Tax=Rhizophagus irregularis TaxID=588596 RepID=A0A2I1HHB0_9GLOM|nr:hypothetical protein RhiirA4_480030 [Rhizophagus irregularis]